MLSERYNARKWPLILGFLVLIASQIMFMEAPNYAVMCVARVLQGVASAIVFVVGLALVCVSFPSQHSIQSLADNPLCVCYIVLRLRLSILLVVRVPQVTQPFDHGD